MKSEFANWSDVRVFLAVMRTGSTLAASKVLNMAQPTVARRIEALEHALKLDLFQRDTRGFHLTEAGEHLCEAATVMETGANQLAVAAQAERRASFKPIRITAPAPSFSPRFAAILSEFKAQSPGTEFEFLSSHDVLDLCAGEADVGLRFARTIADERLICIKLTTVSATLYGSKSYADLHGLPKDECEFAGHRFVVVSNARATFNINHWLEDRISPDQIVSRSTDIESVIAPVLAGLGIGPIPMSLACDHPDLLPCFNPPQGTEAHSWLVISPEAYKRPEVKDFAKFFAPRFRSLFKHLK